MESLDLLLDTASLKCYQTKTPQTVAKLLLTLGMENKFFVVMVNGKKSELEDIIPANSEIMILPKLAGG